ncbi:MAG: Jag N-terminal domain-containing protein [Epsilonproteobacteria bacterium]|nr:Jag N-terminal domain-containing protein [Campylobacterota bacterium]
MEKLSEDFIAFEGSTLEEAYKKASLEFQCSIIDLKSDIIQAPSSGFFGFFKKNAIIKVYRCDRVNKQSNQDIKSKFVKNDGINIKDISSQMEEMHTDADSISLKSIRNTTSQKSEDQIFNTFYDKKVENFQEIKIIKSDKILEEIKEKIDGLFSLLSYEIEPVTVSYYDEKTLFIEFSGKDSALLIGKEGYRYKALSYILFNWIHEKYDLMIRLEIAEFLSSQEESINKYLEPVIETIKVDGFYKTRNLDGILIHIALTRLRMEFPEKYIAVKSNIKGEKYILVNEYRK